MLDVCLIGKRERKIGREPIELRLRLLEADAGLQLRHDAQEDVVARAGLVVDAVGDHDVGARIDVGAGRKQQLEPGRQHADDIGAAVAELDGLADDRFVAAVAALPELVAEDRDVRQRRWRRRARRRHRIALARRRRRLRRAVFFDEVAAELNAMPEQAEEVGGRAGAGDLLRIALAVAADGRTERVDAGEAVELRQLVRRS